MLAQAGDLVGFEALFGQPYQLSASAFTPAVLRALVPASEAQRQQWLIEALLQQPQRSHDMARLRTGPVAVRTAQLLKVLGHAPALQGQAHDPDALRESLPALRDLAQVVDAKSETVCRALAQLLPPRTRKGGPRPWAAAGVVAAQALGLAGHGPALGFQGAAA